MTDAARDYREFRERGGRMPQARWSGVRMQLRAVREAIAILREEGRPADHLLPQEADLLQKLKLDR